MKKKKLIIYKKNKGIHFFNFELEIIFDVSYKMFQIQRLDIHVR